VNDLERRARAAMQGMAEEVRPGSSLPDVVRRRVRRRQAVIGGVAGAAFVVGIAGIGLGVSALRDEDAIRIQSPAPPAGACVPGWVVAAKPFTDDVSSDSLVAAAGTSPTDMWAVGTRFLQRTQAGDTVALIEHWDGTGWTVVSGADTGGRGAFLNDVVALAPDDVWAVGGLAGLHGDDLIEHWDGTNWSLVEGAGEHLFGLGSIIAVGPDDLWAHGVGYPVVGGESISRDVYEHWDGATWSTWIGRLGVDPSEGTAATQVLAAGPSGEVWAAGGKVKGFGEAGRLSGALVERWDGETWAETPSPSGDQPISGLGVLGEHDVWALTGGGLREGGLGYGGGENALVHWNGSDWGRPFAIDGTVMDVIARGADDVWAVGSDQDGRPLIERWNGERWQQVDSNLPGEVSSGLLSATATPTGALIAFGSDYPSSKGGAFEGPIGEMSNYLWIDCG
jgi:hypothetical protein